MVEEKNPVSQPDRTSPLEFLRQTKVELGLVNWPNRKETIKLTGLVIAVSLITGLYLGALDALFTNLFSNIIK